MREIYNWVNGSTDKSSDDFIPIVNPATDQVVAQVAMADRRLIDNAIESAEKAGEGWAMTPQAKRAAVLIRFRQLLLENRDEIAALITKEHGKTLDDAVGEVMRGLDSVDLAIGGPALTQGRTNLQTGPGIDTKSVLHPVGVCVGITPFNFPIMMGLMMLSVALSSGNTFIWKPSEQDPSAAIRVAELFKEAGLPDGALNVVHGRQDAAEQLIDDTRTRAVSFVGSTPVAQAVYTRASKAGKRAQAFGGAKNHLIVMPDADTEAVSDQLVSASFGAAGQRCMAISVAVVVGGGKDDLLKKLAPKAEAVKMASGDTSGAEVGPVVSRSAQERIRGIVDEAISLGATAVVDRKDEVVPGNEDGYFVGPVILSDVAVDSPAYEQEIFGPVLVVMQVETLDEAIALIRNHRYGNGASIFTNDARAVAQFERQASAGMLGVNVAIPVPVATYSVQGWKDSAFGDTGLNNASWSFYTRPKYVTSRWESVRGTDFGFSPN